MPRILLLLPLLLAGCIGKQSLSSWINGEPKPSREVDLAVSVRVHQVGRQILSANPFSGADATFQVIGHEDAVLFHRDRVGVFISDNLVVQCKTDDELAAVLCTELGKMVAEERNLARMGYSELFPQVPTENAASNNAIDPLKLAEGALHDRSQNRRVLDDSRKEMIDPAKIAAELHKAAGYDGTAFAAVEPILTNTNRNRDLLKQLGAGGTAPIWSR